MKFLLFLPVLLLLSCAAKKQPNILWINAEDMSANFSCYGEQTIQTPNVDNLAMEGTRFLNTHVTGPVCSASRSALITGMYQTSIGAHNHRSSRGDVKIYLPDSINLIPGIFQKHGYYTVNAGYDYHAKTDYNFIWNPQVYSHEAEIDYDGHNWNDLFEKRKDGQPWFIQLQLQGGKNRYPGIENLVNPDSVKLPPYYPDNKEFKEDHARFLNSVIHVDNIVGKIIEKLKETGEYENTCIFFFTDHGTDNYRDKQYLYDGGTHIPLIITGPGVEKNKVRDELISHIDIAATSLYFAGIEISEYMEGKPFYGNDYNPREYLVSARDRCDWTKDRIRSVRTKQYKYIRNFHPEYPYMQSQYRDDWPTIVKAKEMFEKGELTDAQAKFFSDYRPTEEFYVVSDDPYEIYDQIGNEEYIEQIDKMRSYLNDWIKKTSDKGEIPESDESYLQSLINVNTGTVFEGFPIVWTIDPLLTNQEIKENYTSFFRAENKTDKPLDIRVNIAHSTQYNVSEDQFIMALKPFSQSEKELNITQNNPEGINTEDTLTVYVETNYSFGNNTETTYTYSRYMKPVRSFQCNKALSKPLIDGNLNEWIEKDFYDVDKAHPGEAQFGVMYDNEYVYIAVEVADDEITSKPDAYTWLQDGVEIRIDARQEPERSNAMGMEEFIDHLALITSPGTNGTPVSLYKSAKIRFGCPDMFTDNGIKTAHKITNDGHVFETAVPIRYFNSKQKGKWNSFRMNIVVHDKDGNEQKRVEWVKNWGSMNKNIIGSGTFFKN